MRKKWLKRLLRLLLAPILLFAVLMALLYVPPIQHFLQRQVTERLSASSGYHISLERIDLRFPFNLLVRGACVTRAEGDTLLTLGSLNTRIEILPLLKGRVAVSRVSLHDASVNTAGEIEGVSLKGTLGSFVLSGNDVDLRGERVRIGRLSLEDTRLHVELNDTVDTPEDTLSTPLPWQLRLDRVMLRDVSVSLHIPRDSLRLAAHAGDLALNNARADLRAQCYAWESLRIASTSLSYDTGNARPSEGLDVSHIHLRNLMLGLDSLNYCGQNLSAVLNECSFDERSGLYLASLTGRLKGDAERIELSSLQMRTPHSTADLSALAYWEMMERTDTGRVALRLDARIGKQDVLLLSGISEEVFKQAYPFHPMVVQASVDGNLSHLNLSRLKVNLPGALALDGRGAFRSLTDSVQRSGSVELEVQTGDLRFLSALAGVAPGGALAVPDSMKLAARIGLNGQRADAHLLLREQEGTVELTADYNAATEGYRATLDVQSLQLNHFLPKDSLYGLTLQASVQGRGTDFASRRSRAAGSLTVGSLRYGRLQLTDMGLKGELRDARLTAELSSDNALLKMAARASTRLDSRNVNGSLHADVHRFDLNALALPEWRTKNPITLRLDAEARQDSLRLQLDAGDLAVNFHAADSWERLQKHAEGFVSLLESQWKVRHLEHTGLRQALPTAALNVRAGKNNPVSDLLAVSKHITFNDFDFGFDVNPLQGINGNTRLQGLRVDSLRLDTIFLAMRQDTARMALRGGVINGADNPQHVFRGTLTGELRSADAELNLNYVDGEEHTGLDLGIHARPITDTHHRSDGMLFRLTPAEPIIAFRKFRFVEENNWIYLHRNMRVYASVDMKDNDDVGFRMRSVAEDTLSLQNINVELLRLRLADVSRMFPYIPRLTGLLSAHVHYVQDDATLRMSGKADVESLTYERQPVGNVGCGFSWTPVRGKGDQLRFYASNDGNEILLAEGAVNVPGRRDSLQVSMQLKAFPLSLANAFVPDRMVALNGKVGGEFAVAGTPSKPLVNGALQMDDVSLYARQAGARYRFDSQTLRVDNSTLRFNNFTVSTTGKEPLTISGTVNFRNLQKPVARIDVRAREYTLLDAPRTRESLVYGKIFVDLNASLNGPLDALTMRGNMNLLGKTDFTYVMTDTPLTVEDRLGELVTFTSFRDTATVKNEVPSMSLGGMNMLMTMHIDDAVRIRADLSPDRSSRVELEGGGDLTLQYTPQGTVNISGRYTLQGGKMKYTLPVIPLKEFEFVSGSYVDWRGDAMNPTLNLTAKERMRAAVSDGSSGGSRMVNFDVSVSIKNRLKAPELIFNLEAPEDATIQNELMAMAAEERSKQAVAMLATGIYLNSGVKGGGGLNMGTALNSVLQSQINSLTGSIKNASLNIGIEDRTSSETGAQQTDYSFRYSQRFFNDRVQIVIGGKVSTGDNATNNVESFIDNISLEYRLDNSSTRYVRVFHNKNYESVLDGEITETGAGLVLRRKMDKLSELFLFRRAKRKEGE